MNAMNDRNDRFRRLTRSQSPTAKAEREIGSDEHDWEDVMENKESQLGDSTVLVNSSGLLPSGSSVSLTPRRRKQTTRTVYIANSKSPRKASAAVPTRVLATPRQSPTPQLAQGGPSIRDPRVSNTEETKPAIPQPIASMEEVHFAFNAGARSILIYVQEIASWFFYLLKRPLSIVLVLWALALILNTLSESLRTAFSPFCSLPFASRVPICKVINAVHEAGGRPSHAEYPAMVELQSKTFEQLLDEGVGGSSLALEVKKAEMATADLIAVVRTSDLRSREHLADTLEKFIGGARNTARGLQKLNAKVSSSVDSILAISDYALRTIEAAESKRASSLMNYIFPFGSNTDSDLLSSTFAQSLSVLSTSLENLILSAEVSLRNLDELDAQLGTIHEILVREDKTLTSEHSELLAELWTILGGNRARKQRFEANFFVLKELGSYRSRALAHVITALQALQTLSADMEELRERAAAPELSGDKIPLEVHARAIRSGIQRLNEDRLRAKEKEEEATRRILGVGAIEEDS